VIMHEHERIINTKQGIPLTGAKVCVSVCVSACDCLCALVCRLIWQATITSD